MAKVIKGTQMEPTKTTIDHGPPANAAEPDANFWMLKLYIAGKTPKAITALANLEKICAEQLEGKYSIQVIDLLVTPQLAADDQILALPTLVRKLPMPVRKIIGDLSNTERVLVGLDLLAADRLYNQ